MAIHCAQQGDQQAWGHLVETHIDAVFAFCLKLASGDNHATEDITQETFMIAARRIHRFKPHQGELRAWLFGIARHRTQKWITAQARRYRRERLHSPPSENDHDHTQVMEVLTNMDTQDRDLLQAKYLKDQTVKQIAHARQISEHAAESRLRRARDRFALAYKKHINPT